MLRAIARVLRPGGRLAFLTIEPTPGLDGRDRRRAHRAGPPAVAVRTSYSSLMRSAGFVDIEATDVTGEYGDAQRRWIETSERHRDELRQVMGNDEYDDRYGRRTNTRASIDAGLLSRSLYTAVR